MKIVRMLPLVLLLPLLAACEGNRLTAPDAHPAAGHPRHDHKPGNNDNGNGEGDGGKDGCGDPKHDDESSRGNGTIGGGGRVSSNGNPGN